MRIPRIPFFLTSLLGVILFFGCTQRKKVSKEKIDSASLQLKDQEVKNDIVETPTITVFVHGTRLITKFALQELFYTPQGMIHAPELSEKYHMRRLVNLLSERDSQRFQIDNYYLFGWSGELNFKARKEAARNLYNELTKLTNEYQQRHSIKPNIRIITHSHGGNVALNLAAIKEENPSFSINELILLACPVQEKTKQLVNDPLFERVYSFFSHGDMLQVMDPQGLYKKNKGHPLFSRRLFPSNPKLSQIKIKIHGRSILHIEFILRRFMESLPAILDAVERDCQQLPVSNVLQDDYVIIDLAKKHKRKSNKRVLII